MTTLPARRLGRGGRRAALLLPLLLAACETGPQVVSNAVAQCIEHVKRPAYCRCLGAGLEKNYSYAKIREYRLKTDNWTLFNDVRDDERLMAIDRDCRDRTL